MQRLRKLARFYARYPWSSVLVVLWIISTVCGVRVLTGTPFAFGFTEGLLSLAWYPDLLDRARPIGPAFDWGWNADWRRFFSLMAWIEFEFRSVMFMPAMFVMWLPSWLVLSVPRCVAAVRNIRALRRVSGIPCTRCRYDMPEGVPVCPECGTSAPTRKPRKRSILLGELKTFGLLVALPLATMTALAIIGMLV